MVVYVAVNMAVLVDDEVDGGVAVEIKGPQRRSVCQLVD